MPRRQYVVKDVLICRRWITPGSKLLSQFGEKTRVKDLCISLSVNKSENTNNRHKKIHFRHARLAALAMAVIGGNVVSKLKMR